MNNKILVVTAHPDDEILGCGGTVAKLVREGYEAHTLILGEGITSRDEKRDAAKRESCLEELKEQARKANGLIGVSEVITYGFPDNRFDEVSLLDIVKVIESVKRKIKPDVVFTHYSGDLNVDHQIVYEAVITATRPLNDECVKEIFSFEVLSSTEWNYPLSFSPDTFYDISSTLELKLNAMREYSSELKESPHPRSLEGVRVNAKSWGIKMGLDYAEAFKCVRRVIRK